MVSCVGIVSPGSMGAAVGRSLRGNGLRVVAALSGRSGTTRARAAEAGLEDVGDLPTLVTESDVVLSIVPPGTAESVADAVAAALADHGAPPAEADAARPTVVDANAVAPATARRVASRLRAAGARPVDGGIVGGPPAPGRQGTVLFLSGEGGDALAAALTTPALEVRWLGPSPVAASALKVCYAAWTKGTTALVLAIRGLARAEGVDDALVELWGRSQQTALARAEGAPRTAGRAWRWVDEMEEIAAALEAAGLPGGTHHAAAEVYRRLAQYKDTPTPPPLDAVLASVLGVEGHANVQGVEGHANVQGVEDHHSAPPHPGA